MPRFDRATVDVRVVGVNPYGPVTYRIRVDDLEDAEFVLTEAQLPWQLRAMAQAAEAGIVQRMKPEDVEAAEVIRLGLEAFLKGERV